MTLTQVRAALAACDRRDAALALQAIQTTHAACAPLMVGKAGRSTYEKCVLLFRQILAGTSGGKARERSAFKALLTKARLNTPPANKTPS